MTKYCVSYSVRGYLDVYVEASSKEEAIELAKEKMYEADCGELIDPQSELLDCWEDS